MSLGNRKVQLSLADPKVELIKGGDAVLWLIRSWGRSLTIVWGRSPLGNRKGGDVCIFDVFMFSGLGISLISLNPTRHVYTTAHFQAVS